MGKVAATFRLLPDSPEADLALLRKHVEAAVPSGMSLARIDERPFAFGLHALLVSLILPDAEGGVDAAEAALGKIPGIQSVEVLELGLI